MTNAEQNRAIQKLARQLREKKIDPYSENAKKEFERLHDADKSFEGLTATSLKALIAINRTYRYIPFHLFGIYVEI